MPAGAVDAHGHVVGAPPDFPFVAGRTYTPPEAPPGDYLRMLDNTGLAYGVLVQISAHGTDNRLLVNALNANPGRLLGVVAVPLGLPSQQLRDLADAGVRAARLNVVYGGGVGIDSLQEHGAMCRDLGWHLQVLVDARELPALAPRLARLPVPVVVDHMGHFPVSAGAGSPGFQALVSLVKDGAWVKLAAPYRISPHPYTATTELAQALLAAAPERCLWGTDWPHVAHWDRMMNVGELLDLLHDWAPDEATRQAVLVDNPTRLFGLPVRG